MNVHEYQAKELLAKYGVGIPAGIAALTVEDAVAAAKQLPGPLYVVKAQIHAGGRGKGKFKELPADAKGGVRLAKSLDEVELFAKEMLGNTLVTIQTGEAGKQVNRLYVTDGVDIASEYYLSMVVDRASGRIALIVSTCDLYWDLGFTHQQLATGQATLTDQRRIRDLVGVQRTFGRVSSLEVAEAQAAIAAQETALSALQQHLVEDRAALDILSGARAGEGTQDPPGLATSLPPAPPPGLPADLLSRRPDLRAAEMRLRATFDTREAVRASLYPDLVLTGAGGAASPALAHLFDHPVGSLLAAVSLPFLDLPRHWLNTAVARANQQIAELDFRKAVLQALADVDNALSRRTRLVEQRASLAAELTAAARAEDLYAVRYRSGAVPLRVWLEAQQNHRSARLALDANQLALLQNHAQLSAALGGGATQ